MGGVKRVMKLALIVVALALVAGFVWLVSRPDGPDVVTGSDASQGPRFEVRVERPRMDRFLFGVLPVKVEEKLLGVGELRFDHASRGARVGSVSSDRIELRADGWDLLIETDGKGGIAQGTRLVFPMELAGVWRTLRCRPADGGNGYLYTTTREGSGVLDGQFLVELSPCENAETGKLIDTEAGASPGQAWPSPPYPLRGSFAGLPQGRR
jgi:hypothetical protein